MLNTYRAWGLDCTLGSECRFIVVFSFKLLAMQAQSHCLGYDFKGLRMQEQNRAWGMLKLLLHWDTSLAGITNPRANGIAIRAQNGEIGLGEHQLGFTNDFVSLEDADGVHPSRDVFGGRNKENTGFDALVVVVHFPCCTHGVSQSIGIV